MSEDSKTPHLSSNDTEKLNEPTMAKVLPKELTLPGCSGEPPKHKAKHKISKEPSKLEASEREPNPFKEASLTETGMSKCVKLSSELFPAF